MTDRRYPRTARVNELVHEVLAEELERLSDPRLDLVTITGVQVSPDLKHARVFYSSLQDGDEETEVTPGDDRPPSATQEHVADAAKALESARRPLQTALGRQVRLKYVPRLVFQEDPVVRSGRRIDDIIRHLHQPPDEGPKE